MKIRVFPSGSHTARFVVLMLSVIGFSSKPLAETRGFAVTFFYFATDKYEQKCTTIDGGWEDVEKRVSNELSQKYKDKDIKDIKVFLDRDFQYRGWIDGKRANVVNYPMSVPDPEYATVSGQYAYGFDLDGRGADTAHAFQDPETGEKGVDNQMFRALGCFRALDIKLPERPQYVKSYWEATVPQLRLGAWVFAIEGDDLSKDGDATVSFYRAISHVRKNSSNEPLEYATYVTDNSPRNYGKFPGKIKNGVFTSDADAVNFQLVTENQFLTKMSLSQARLRLQLNSGKAAEGYMAGYQPWMDAWFRLARYGAAYAGDAAGIYYNLKKMADAKPDANTGENTAISATFRIESIPAFLVRQDGTLITDAH